MYKFKYIFGPVPSRRLGFSLGIDLVPYKTCNFNCIYCECGKTTNLTNNRCEFYPVNEIINELDFFLKNYNSKIDYITFSGAGEPLLYSKISEIILFLKKKFNKCKIALLTNGSLFYLPEIIEEVKQIDLIIPSLDAGNENTFRKINRPHKDLKFSEIINGLINLRKKFKNKIFLEVFFVEKLNDSTDEVKQIKKIIDEINPDKIQINTIDRPPAYNNINPVNILKLKNIKKILGEKSEIITFKNTSRIKLNNNMSTILNCLERRPLTLEDLISITDLHVNEINKILRKLEENGKILKFSGKRGIFYKLK